MLTHISKRKEKRWIIGEDTTPEAQRTASELASALGVSGILARLLCIRGYKTPREALSFLRLENEILGDPFLLRDMQEAVERIVRAVREKEHITVYGDYDVDGVTAVCTLLLYLRSIGGEVDYYIPTRNGEGYGVSVAAIDKLRAAGTSLIITVDTGITAFDEVLHAKKLGMDVVVTDHHECQHELPEAVAVVNPHRHDCPYSFKELAGVGVVFKLICAIEESVSGDDRMACVSRICNAYADLISIGTIADVMPIREENKLIVKLGLGMIGRTERPGLSALIQAVSQKGNTRDTHKAQKTQKITSSYIGYTLAPRINAAGRIRSASMAVELFLAEDQENADFLAHELCEANRLRQAEENRIMQEAYAQIEETHDFEHDPVIVICSDEWHHGVIGIVASRVTEKYGLPSILVSFEGCDPVVQSPSDVGKGSGRSIKGLNLATALMNVGDTLLKYGGHELAAGLSLTRGMFDTFHQKINDYARAHLTDDAIVPTLYADAELLASDLSLELAREIRRLEPFGVGNPVPVFILRGVTVNEISPISGGKHTKLLVTGGEYSYQALCFGMPSSSLNLLVGDRADLLFTLDVNEWAGRSVLQLIVKDIRRSEESERAHRDDKERFFEIWEGAPFGMDENVVPTRNHFAAVYTVLRQSARIGIDCLSYRAILSRLYPVAGNEIGYIRLRMIVRILEELSLVGVEELSDETCRFTVYSDRAKTDLEKSAILRRLRAMEQK